MPPVLETTGLTRHFGGIIAANAVSLSIAKGARHALIGPNGAGKTTLINLLTGVLRPTEGRIMLEGQDITNLEAHKRVQLGIARTFQINQLFADLTPLETIGLAVSERMELGRQWWRLVGSKGIVIEESVDILGRFHLADVMDERTGDLPYGKQRLLEIALAIACRPRVLLLDEPAAGLDLAGREELVARLAGLAADPYAPALVLVTHHVEEIPPGFTHALLLRAGRVVAAGSIENVVTAETLSATFGLPLEVHRHRGRFAARLAD
jgi:ABC-type branched-subunit amino acid transport system ATPase component